VGSTVFKTILKQIKTFRMKEILSGLGILILICIVLFFTGVIGKGCNQAVKATHIDDATIVYEEYQEIYNTCSKLNTDLGNMKELPETDKMFEQFSKAQRINTIKTQLNRWVEDYNAKSKMWGKSLWKSTALPYQLDVNNFSNYTNK
jgi:hypothetical protein